MVYFAVPIHQSIQTMIKRPLSNPPSRGPPPPKKGVLLTFFFQRKKSSILSFWALFSFFFPPPPPLGLFQNRTKKFFFGELEGEGRGFFYLREEEKMMVVC